MPLYHDDIRSTSWNEKPDSATNCEFIPNNKIVKCVVLHFSIVTSKFGDSELIGSRISAKYLQFLILQENIFQRTRIAAV